MNRKIKTALISVSDKKNLKPLLNILKKNKIKIISSGGTYKEIIRLKFKCLEVSKFTNSPDEGIVIEDKSNPEKNSSQEFKPNEIFKASDMMVAVKFSSSRCYH